MKVLCKQLGLQAMTWIQILSTLYHFRRYNFTNADAGYLSQEKLLIHLVMILLNLFISEGSQTLNNLVKFKATTAALLETHG